MGDIGTSPSETVLMGDQVFTDVWAAHNAGIKGILVPPINDKKERLKRFFFNAFLAKSVKCNTFAPCYGK